MANTEDHCLLFFSIFDNEKCFVSRECNYCKCISGCGKYLSKRTNCIDIRHFTDKFAFVVEEHNNEINCCKIQFFRHFIPLSQLRWL